MSDPDGKYRAAMAATEVLLDRMSSRTGQPPEIRRVAPHEAPVVMLGLVQLAQEATFAPPAVAPRRSSV